MADETTGTETTGSETTGTETTGTETTGTETTGTETKEQTEEKSGGIEASLQAAASAKDSASKDAGKTTANKDGEDGSDSKGQPEGAPDEYADFNAPEGYSLGEGGEAKFKEQMKEFSATQETAQSLYSIIADLNNEFLEPGLVEAQDAAFAERAIEWEGIAKKDPRLGGENGELWDATIAYSNNVLDKMDEIIGKGAEGLGGVKDMLIKNGWLSHPNTLLFIHEVGKLILPDTLDPPGDGGGAGDKNWDEMTLAEKLGYGKDALSKQGRFHMRQSGIEIEGE